MLGTRGPGALVTLRNLATACGVLAGIGGFTHGIGELAQGGRAPGVVFDSWAEGRIADNLGGEPAMTFVPDLMATGALTVAASAAVVVWAGWFVDARFGGTGLALLSVLMLAVGGGFGPPVLGLLAALVAGGAHWRRRPRGPLPGHLRSGLATAWPGLFWLCLLDAAFLTLGSLVAAVLLDAHTPDPFVYGLFLAVVAMPVATLAGVAEAAGG